MSYLDQAIKTLLASTERESLPLSGGAQLDWTPRTSTLTATRLNRGLESSPNEQTTFEAYIRRAGYTHTPGQPCAWVVDAMGNERVGVQWTITQAKPSKKSQHGDAQPSLF